MRALEMQAASHTGFVTYQGGLSKRPGGVRVVASAHMPTQQRGSLEKHGPNPDNEAWRQHRIIRSLGAWQSGLMRWS